MTGMFKYIVYLFPLAAIAFIIYFFREYRWATKLTREERLAENGLPGERFSLYVHPMERRDFLYLAIITVVYAAFAFSFLGRAENPETFLRFRNELDEVIIDLGGERDITKVTYYTGLFHKDEEAYTLEADYGDGAFQDVLKLEQTHARTFRWTVLQEDVPLSGVTRLRLTANRHPMELGELALYEGETRLDPAEFSFEGADGSLLFDEQEMVVNRYSYTNSTYFDEIYHARTAYEHIRGIYPYEITHPPLGKLIIGLGIRMFGMNPFGWRFMGVLFGILMVPFMYLFLKNLFGKTRIAVLGTLLFAFDFMHFVQTRIATIDTYGVFFTLLMYYFLYRFIAEKYDGPLLRQFLWLFLAGLSFGLGIASKWTAFYAAAGLVVLYAVHMVSTGRRLFAEGRKTDYWSWFLQIVGASILFFVCVPLVIYYFSYTPYADALGKQMNLSIVLDNQKYMLNYHSGVNQAHSYQSSWWMWLFDARPILYYLEYPATGMREAFSAFLNPMLTWAGLVAIIILAVRLYKRFSSLPFLILIGYGANFLPWLLISRTTFAYHYFPSLIFLVLALMYIADEFIEKQPHRTRLVTVFCLVIVLLFVPFFPSLTGITVPAWYSELFTRWLPSWVV